MRRIASVFGLCYAVALAQAAPSCQRIIKVGAWNIQWLTATWRNPKTLCLAADAGQSFTMHGV